MAADPFNLTPEERAAIEADTERALHVIQENLRVHRNHKEVRNAFVLGAFVGLLLALLRLGLK